MRLRRLLAVASACTALLLAGCEDIGHPFQPEYKPLPPELAARGAEATVITVAPVEGVPGPLGQALADAMAAALEKRNLPIVVESGSDGRALYSISGRLQRPSAGGASAILWEVRDAQDTLVGRHIQPLPPGDPSAAAVRTRLLADVENEPARMMVKGIEGDAPVPALPRPAAAHTAAAPPSGHSLAVIKIEGAPGSSGDVALRQAIEYALKVAKVNVVTSRAPDSLLLQAKVELSAVGKDKELQHVKVTWTVERPGGKQLGQVSQENNVPTRLLERVWSEIANAVAQNAVQGIAAIVAEADQPKSGS
jgi:hypothetical protein